jgi:hypothetical protein
MAQCHPLIPHSKKWGIENGLHWMHDVNFNEDGCRASKDNSPKNLNILRTVALNLLRAVDGGKRVSVNRKMLRACTCPGFSSQGVVRRVSVVALKTALIKFSIMQYTVINIVSVITLMAPCRLVW